MIIPVSPVPVRIALETQSINNGGYVVHDIDVAELFEKADSAQYELQLCYGTTSIYRSAVYHINKTGKTITFFFMVGQDLFTAALTAANNRCTFAKMSAGLSENEVLTIVQNEINDGVGQYLASVDATDGFTISLPDVASATGQFAAGRLLLIGPEQRGLDFYFNKFSGWQIVDGLPSGSDYKKTDLSVNGQKTGMHITYKEAGETFNAYVLWYANPDQCVVEEGSYTPA